MQRVQYWQEQNMKCQQGVMAYLATQVAKMGILKDKKCDQPLRFN